MDWPSLAIRTVAKHFPVPRHWHGRHHARIFARTDSGHHASIDCRLSFAGRHQPIERDSKRLESLYSLGGSLDPIASDTFDAVDLLSKVDISNYTPTGNAQYPQTEYGTALKQVAQIAKAEIGLEVACVDIGGWDTHNAEGATNGDMPKLLDELSSGLAALYTDMGDAPRK